MHSRILIWNPANNGLEVRHPKNLPIICIDHASSRGKRCGNRIAQHYITAAQFITRHLSQTKIPIYQMMHMKMFTDLARATLCRQYHQYQAQWLAGMWFRRSENCLSHLWFYPSVIQTHGGCSDYGSHRTFDKH